MSITGIGSGSSLLVQSLADMRSRLDDLQRQLGTGQKADTYAGLGLERGLGVGLRAQLSALDGYGDAITNLGMRLDLAQTALGQISTIGQSVKSVMSPAVPIAFDGNGRTSGQSAALIQLDEILGLLKKLNREQSLTIVMVTHDQAIARQADHIVRLVEGRVAAAA